MLTEVDAERRRTHRGTERQSAGEESLGEPALDVNGERTFYVTLYSDDEEEDQEEEEEEEQPWWGSPSQREVFGQCVQ